MSASAHHNLTSLVLPRGNLANHAMREYSIENAAGCPQDFRFAVEALPERVAAPAEAPTPSEDR